MKAVVSIAFALVLGLAPRAPAQGAPPPSRPVRFTTDEATWLSLDVSPDGKTIVFELLGDLYSLPITGGAARPILTGPAFESQPRFAPDGKRIVYISDQSGADNVWIADADGGHPRQVTQSLRPEMVSPEWTADGRAILVSLLNASGFRTSDLWRFDVETGAGTKLVENTSGPGSQLVSAMPAGPLGPAPTPDGKAFYYVAATPRAYGTREGPRTRLLRRDLATGRDDAVPVELANPFRPAVSPDGEWLAYGARGLGRTGLRLRHLADGVERWLVTGLDRDELEAFATRDILPGYAFTPDSRAVLVTRGGKIHRIDLADGTDRLIPFSAAVAIDLPPPLRSPRRLETGPVRARFLQQPAVGPDGRLAFSALARIYVAARDGASPRRLTTTSHPREFAPAWSHDGNWVAFVTWTSQGGALWKAKADGSGPPVRLSEAGGFYADPAWSPDDARVIVLRAPEGSARSQRGPIPSDADVVSVPAAGGPATRITAAGPLRHPHFGADPSRVFLFSASGGLVSVRLDGTERRVHATLPANASLGPPGYITDGAVAPDGRQLVVLLGERLLRFPLGADTGTAALDPARGEVLSNDAPEAFTWAPDARSLTWVTGRKVHTQSFAATGEADGAERTDDVSVTVPRVAPAGTVVLRGARAVTMRGAEVIENADIVVTANRIAAVGPRGKVTVPAGATVIDVAGKTVIPGLIDIHAHWDIGEGYLQPDATPPYANLAYGVTTVRDPQTLPQIFAEADLAEAGEMPSPRIFSTGPGLFSATDFQSVEQVRRTIERYRDRWGTWLLKSYVVGSRRQRQLVIAAAAAMGMMPTAEGGSDAKMDLTHPFDGMSGTEHLPNVPLYRDVVELFARSGITYTPTLLVAFGGPLTIFKVLQEKRPFQNPKLRRFNPEEALFQRGSARMLWFPPEEYQADRQAAGAAAILRAGGRVALGGHGEMQGIQNQWEMELLASGGMTPAEILRVATINGAEAIGLAEDLGSLEPGKMADLVVLDRNPLADIRNAESVRYVMKNGFLYAGDTLDRLWPGREPLPSPWWWRLRGLSLKPQP